ncbi:hypothetical protein [Bacillus sp. Marseille-P3661]|uniref:hypothetical protein n=1 Tax=Bacillus sp. Marseille-P3661 TaxID=1936234 RepID=UPI000C860DAA|nr:hypothetical protein [Bacillus sp. Marseille-P3661]
MFKFLPILIILFLAIPYVTTSEVDILNCASFKLTIKSKGEEIEWEYENPDEYEIEIGNNVIKDEKAKKEINALFNDLALTKHTDVNQVVDVMKNRGFKDIDELVIKVKFHDEYLWTWTWNK